MSRHPSANSILRNIKREEKEIRTPIASEIFLPNYSGVKNHKDIKNLLPYGEVFVNDNTSVTAVSSTGFVQFLHFNTNGHNNQSTPDHTENHIIIDVPGVYMVDSCVNIRNDSGSAHDIEVVVAKNNGTTIFPNMRRHRTLGTGADIGAIPICGHLSLNIGDTLEIWIISDSSSSRNVIAEDVVLMITRIAD